MMISKIMEFLTSDWNTCVLYTCCPLSYKSYFIFLLIFASCSVHVTRTYLYINLFYHVMRKGSQP